MSILPRGNDGELAVDVVEFEVAGGKIKLILPSGSNVDALVLLLSNTTRRNTTTF